MPSTYDSWGISHVPCVLDYKRHQKSPSFSPQHTHNYNGNEIEQPSPLIRHRTQAHDCPRQGEAARGDARRYFLETTDPGETSLVSIHFIICLKSSHTAETIVLSCRNHPRACLGAIHGPGWVDAETGAQTVSMRWHAVGRETIMTMF